MLSFVLMGAFLALPGCEKGPEMVDPGVIDDAVRQTLDSGSATVQGEFVVDELEGRDTEILAMKGEVDFEAAAQSLEFSDSQAQPEETAEVNHLISDGAGYFVDNAEVASGYPAGTEWVRWTFDDPAPEGGIPRCASADGASHRDQPAQRSPVHRGSRTEGRVGRRITFPSDR
jgi:hypothetical protein